MGYEYIPIKDTVLLGAVEGNVILTEYYDQTVTALVSGGIYDRDQDVVMTDEDISEYEYDLIDYVKSTAPEYAEQVLFFDNGGHSDIDLALELAPYVFNGIQCVLLSTEGRETSHELINCFTVGKKSKSTA